MKYYFIYKNQSMRAFTTSKDVLNKFLSQRKKYDYDIKKLDENKIDNKIVKTLEERQYELIYYNGYYLCSDEEEYFLEGLNDYFCQTRNGIDKLNSLCKLVKLTDKEKEIIQEMILYLAELIGAADELFFEDICDTEYDRYLKIDDMIKEIIKQFN
jgi:uncharacterized protein YpuA (DUF1002 family)